MGKAKQGGETDSYISRTNWCLVDLLNLLESVKYVMLWASNEITLWKRNGRSQEEITKEKNTDLGDHSSHLCSVVLQSPASRQVLCTETLEFHQVQGYQSGSHTGHWGSLARLSLYLESPNCCSSNTKVYVQSPWRLSADKSQVVFLVILGNGRA